MNKKISWWNQEVTNTKGTLWVFAIIIVLFTHYVVGIWEKETWEEECEARIAETIEYYRADFFEERDKYDANIQWCEENLYRCASGNDENGAPLDYYTDRYEGWVK